MDLCLRVYESTSLRELEAWQTHGLPVEWVQVLITGKTLRCYKSQLPSAVLFLVIETFSRLKYAFVYSYKDSRVEIKCVTRFNRRCRYRC